MTRHPALLTTGELLRAYRWVFLGFWAVVLGGWATVVAIIHALDKVPPIMWHSFSATAPKWFLFVLAIIVATVHLPIYVAHGITRRHFAIGAALGFGVAAVASPLVLLLGFGIETVLVPDRDDPTITSVGDAFQLLVTVPLHYLAFAAAGWLIGLVFYRFPWWIGLFLAPFTFVPPILMELFVDVGPWEDDLVDRLRLGATPVAATVAIAAATVVAGAAAAYAVVRDVRVRKVSS